MDRVTHNVEMFGLREDKSKKSKAEIIKQRFKVSHVIVIHRDLRVLILQLNWISRPR